MIFYSFINILKNYSEILILLFIVTSFFLYFAFQKEQEGICVSTPFSFNQKTKKSTSPGSNDSSTSSTSFTSSSAQEMIQSYVSIMDSIEKDMKFIKSIIPINFALGVVNNTDEPSKISLYGKLPNIFMNFSIKNPPYGPTGLLGEDAPPYGVTGKEGPTGPIGETGYWGTTKDTLY
jgi:hypothetical protein